jgi:glycosyltransferase involved in cell wall biosynthesis
MAYSRISIVVPSYNQGRFLEQTLRSLICQKYPDLEIFVLDGGSKDESVEILKRYERYLAYWRSQQDDGQAAVIAEGLGMATGDICAFVNSDDMLAGDALHTVAQIFSSNPTVNWLVGDTCLIDEFSRPYHYLREPYISRKWETFIRGCIPQPSVFWRRSLYERCGQVNPKLTYAMDLDLFYQFWSSDEPLMVRKLLSYQRHHSESKTALQRNVKDVRDKGMQEYVSVLQKYFQFSGRPSTATTLLWRSHRVGVKSLRLYYLHALLFGLPSARRSLEFVRNAV